MYLENSAKQRRADEATAGPLQGVALPAPLLGLLFWKQQWDLPSVPADLVGLPSPSCRGTGTQARAFTGASQPHHTSVIGQGWVNESRCGTLADHWANQWDEGLDCWGHPADSRERLLCKYPARTEEAPVVLLEGQVLLRGYGWALRAVWLLGTRLGL